MKKIKTATVAVLTGMMAMAAIGTSFALYISKPSALSNTISIKTAADMAYEISGLNQQENKLSPTNPHSYDFKIHGKAGADTIFHQPYVPVTITVTLDAGTAELANVLSVGGSVTYLKTESRTTEFAATTDWNTITFKTDESDASKKVATLNTYIYVGSTFEDGYEPGGEHSGDDFGAEYNPVNVTVSMDGVSDTDFVTKYANATYSLTVSLTEWVESGTPYLTGQMNDWNPADDKYRMVRNIEANEGTEEWMWLGTIPAGTELKAHAGGNIWSGNIPENEGGKNNNNVAPENMESAYWSGNNGDKLFLGSKKAQNA